MEYKTDSKGPADPFHRQPCKTVHVLENAKSGVTQKEHRLGKCSKKLDLTPPASPVASFHLSLQRIMDIPSPSLTVPRIYTALSAFAKNF